MTRRRKPDNETTEDAFVRRELEQIADNATRSEKVSWERKLDNMNKLLDQLRPIEQAMLDLMAEKQPIIDEISMLRKEMVKECIHPFTHLVHHEDHVVCKFCERRLVLNKSE